MCGRVFVAVMEDGNENAYFEDEKEECGVIPAVSRIPRECQEI